jgi:hypothetical protein
LFYGGMLWVLRVREPQQNPGVNEIRHQSWSR